MDFSTEGIKNLGNSIVSSLKELPTISGISTGIIVLLVLLISKQSTALAIIAGFLTGGFVYLLYNDFLQRRQMVNMEDQKMENVKINILDQRSQDLEKDVCISCNAKTTNKSEPCPKCGFLLDKIKVD